MTCDCVLSGARVTACECVLIYPHSRPMNAIYQKSMTSLDRDNTKASGIITKNFAVIGDIQ